jgi:hypothetical protein
MILQEKTRMQPRIHSFACFFSLLIGASVVDTSPVHSQEAAQIKPNIQGQSPLAAHRAVYDLSLLSSQGTKSIIAAQGRIVFEFSGSPCEGYVTTFRQLMRLESTESGAKTTDTLNSSFESPHGESLNFRSQTMSGGGRAIQNILEGIAKRSTPQAQEKEQAKTPRLESLHITLKHPKPEKVLLNTAQGLDHKVYFPTEHTLELLKAAQEGKSTYAVKVFDGSEDGKQIYDTLTVIGKKMQSSRDLEPQNQKMEAVALVAPLKDQARWPVSISYFKAGERAETLPVYILSFDLYENGVSRDLKLDYGDFALKGELKKIDFLPTAQCP